MGTELVGKVLVKAKIENFGDLENSERGLLPPDQVRSIEVDDALVDTGASTLLLPARYIQKLGLRKFRSRPARGVGGPVAMSMYAAVRLTIQDRECYLDVGEISDDLPVLIGQIPLESLDFVVDPKGQRLIGNPAHGGEHIMEAY
jgi:predicted aspartyl protease